VLHAADACAAPVYAVDELEHDAHHRARGMFLKLRDAKLGPVKQVGVMPRLSATPGAARSPGCRAGAHTRQVLAEQGLSVAQIDALVGAGVVEQGAPASTATPRR
jgi:crotonobetainyl-CoA:carnitine CoA-transferase CaiB-like acyl-CoA transferase